MQSLPIYLIQLGRVLALLSLDGAQYAQNVLVRVNHFALARLTAAACQVLSFWIFISL